MGEFPDKAFDRYITQSPDEYFGYDEDELTAQEIIDQVVEEEK